MTERQIRSRLDSLDKIFAAWHVWCRNAFGRTPVDADVALLRQGYETVPFLAPDGARSLLETVAGRGADSANVSWDNVLQQTIALAPADLTDLERLVAGAMTPAADASLTAYFGCEYFIYWVQANRTFSRQCPQVASNPGIMEEPPVNQWHRDEGPPPFVSIMIYLNGTEEHGGGTEFLDLETTRRLEAAGHGYYQLQEQYGDVAPIMEDLGLAYDPRMPATRAGDALLFQSRDILHRGVVPTRGPRYVVTLLMLPCSLPWSEAYRFWTPHQPGPGVPAWTLEFMSRFPAVPQIRESTDGMNAPAVTC